MAGLQDEKGPSLGRGLLWLAERIVPRNERRPWRHRHHSRLRAWWALVQRGELLFVGPAQVVLFCREALWDAVWRRFNREQLRSFARGPYLVLALLATILLAVALQTHGFAGTRAVVELARARYASMPFNLGDAVVGHIFSLSFGLGIGLGVAAFQRLPLVWCGWSYWTFFVLKTLLVLATVTVLWVEGGAALFGSLPNWGYATITIYFFFWLVSMAAFGLATRWSFVDQRCRCPVCLKRLALPVAMGSWGSVLEPATTEMMCEHGHGSLCIVADGSSAPDHWTVFGPSWQELFETGGR